MSDDESFLTRWSRRKSGAAAKPPGRPGAEKAETGDEAAAAAPSPAGPDSQPLSDLARLPPIDAIGAGSDIRAFLAPGVPAGLARAALRRAWSADPAIRDFIGLSENSWDFNAAGGVPGFGAVAVEDLRQLLAQAMGEKEAADPAPDAAPAEVAQEQASLSAPSDPGLGDPANDDATQHDAARDDDDAPVQRRRHGGALPE